MVTRQLSYPRKGIAPAYKRKDEICKNNFLAPSCTFPFWFDFVCISILSHTNKSFKPSSTIIIFLFRHLYIRGDECMFRGCHRCSPLSRKCNNAFTKTMCLQTFLIVNENDFHICNVYFVHILSFLFMSIFLIEGLRKFKITNN